ncbi:MAG: response regulator transcription factor [Treponema sp.]|nr:response regulator transcription factor [Treponema sp.]
MTAEKPKILIIEDDDDIAGIEKDFLEINGFSAEIQADGVKGTERALSGDFALILLDLMLPGKDGMSICREIREKIDIPILMVSARMEDVDKVRGLDLGADDYITKPFSPAEVVARVKSHIARYRRLTKNTGEAKQAAEIDKGWLKIEHKSRRVFVNSTEINLTNKEYELLYLLAANEGTVFSKEQLYEKIWGEDIHGVIKTVTVHINRLREKIERNQGMPMHIQTVWGTGYRFMS